MAVLSAKKAVVIINLTDEDDVMPVDDKWVTEDIIMLHSCSLQLTLSAVSNSNEYKNKPSSTS